MEFIIKKEIENDEYLYINDILQTISIKGISEKEFYKN